MSEFIKFRNVDNLGDWDFGKGLQSYGDNLLSTMQNIKTRLQSFKWDCFFDLESGIDWFSLLGQRGNAMQDLVELNIRCCILDSLYVKGIKSLTMLVDEKTRKLTINYTIDTIFSEGSDTVSIGGING